jgi:hypothetical protein
MPPVDARQKIFFRRVHRGDLKSHISGAGTGMSDTVEDDDRLSEREVAEQLQALTEAQWARLDIYANSLTHGLASCDGNDVVKMGIEKFLTGRRVWRRGVDAVTTFKKVIRSIASNEWKKQELGPIDASAAVSTTDASPDEDHEQPYAVATNIETPEDVLIAKQFVAQVEAAAADDEEAGLVLMLWLDGKRGVEAAENELGWDKKRYDAARKRLMRRLAPRNNKG